MPSIKIISLLLSICLVTSGAWAEEAESSGEGLNNAEFVEYSKRLNKMTQLQTRVQESTAQLKELIEKKNQGVTEIKDDKNNRKSILTAIVERHKELEKDYAAYNEELRALTYRFPSKGGEIKRKYVVLRPKSLEQVEKELGLDGDLTELKEKVDKKYKAFAPPEEPIPAPPAPSYGEATIKEKPKAEKKPQRLKLSK